MKSNVVSIRRESVPDLISIYRAGLTHSLEWAANASAVQAATQRRAQPSRDAFVIPIHGIIMRRPGLIEQLFGAVSLTETMAMFRAAMADPEIGTVVLSIDSPGGETDGITEAAAEIRAARSQKTIVAVADTMACSAAYWLAASATEIVAAPTSVLGNIGVYVIHDDITGLLEAEGVKRDIIASSDLKAAFADGGSLSQEARDQLQAIVDEQAAMFVSDVAKGRGVSAATVRKDFGGGGILGPTAALGAKMIDRVDSLDGAIRKAMSAKRATALGPSYAEAVIETPTEPTPPPPAPEPRPDLLEIAMLRHRAHVR